MGLNSRFLYKILYNLASRFNKAKSSDKRLARRDKDAEV